MPSRLFSLLALAGLSALVAGCGDGPKVVKVSGTATRNGQPVPSLRLNFQPEKGRPSWADTDKDGRFTLEYDPQTKGAQVGKHTVTAKFQPMTPEEEMGTKKPAPATKDVSAEYGGGKKTLTVEITKETDNLELKFD